MGYWFLTKTHNRVQSVYRFILKYSIKPLRVFNYLREGYKGLKVIYQDFRCGDMKRRITHQEVYAEYPYYGMTKRDWKQINNMKRDKLALIKENRQIQQDRDKSFKRNVRLSFWNDIYWKSFINFYKESSK